MPALRRSLTVLADLLTLWVEARPRSEAIGVLSRTSDAALAARGTTREREIRRIVGLGAD